jgi:hypothetical protein
MGPDEALHAQHRRLKELFGQLANRVGPDIAGNAGSIRELLDTMDHILLAYTAAEDSAAYARLVADARPQVSDLARKFQRDMGALKRAFADYSDKWSRKVIATQPTIFRRETEALIAMFTGRIDREEQELYPLVAAG